MGYGDLMWQTVCTQVTLLCANHRSCGWDRGKVQAIEGGKGQASGQEARSDNRGDIRTRELLKRGPRTWCIGSGPEVRVTSQTCKQQG